MLIPKLRVLFYGTGMLCGSLLFSASALASDNSNKKSPLAHIVTMNGTVVVSKKDMKPGDAVFPGETIETKEKSEAKIIYVDKSIVDLGPSTNYKLVAMTPEEGGAKIESELDFGKVRASIQKKLDKKSKFYIKTKGSVLAVRGTEFLVSFLPNEQKFTEQVVVADGKVEVTPTTAGAKALMLEPGRQFERDMMVTGRSIASVSEPRVSNVNLTDVRARVAEAAVPDRTFTQAVVVGGSSENNNKPTAGGGAATFQAVTASFTPPPPPIKQGEPPPRDMGKPEPLPNAPIGYVDQLNPGITKGNTVRLTVTFTP